MCLSGRPLALHCTLKCTKVRVVPVHDIKEEESERQKEVQEAEGDKERESEVDGVVGERITQRKLEPQCVHKESFNGQGKQ